MMYVKADAECILPYGEKDNDDIHHLCHYIRLLLFQGLVLNKHKKTGPEGPVFCNAYYSTSIIVPF